MTRFAWVVILGIAACGQVADNSNAPDAQTVKLPSAPTAVTATANISAGARLSWSEPATGAPITSYTVTSSPAGGTVKISGTNAIVTGLTVATPYTFTVTATNAGGEGPASEPSNSVTIVAGPAAPASVFACGADASATVRGPAPAAGTTYNLYYDTKPGNSKLGTKQANVTLPLAQTGLTNGTKLYFVLAAVDANGIESDDSPEDSTTPDSVVHDAAFGGSFSSAFAGIEILDCVSKQPPGLGVGRAVKGAATTIAQTNYNNIAVDAAHARIFVRQANTVLVWDNATTVNGNVAPTRTFTSASIGGARGIAYDAQRDLLYVSNFSDIQVFANASTATGAVTPLHGITVTSGSVGALAVDAATDRLFADNQGPILVYDGASQLTGAAPPNRTITISGATVSSFGVAFDATNNTLYVSSRNEGKIYAVANGSTANGAVTPARTNFVTGTSPMGLSVGGNKLVNFQDSATSVEMWNDASALNGTTVPDLKVQFPTLVSGASVVYVP